MTKKNTLPSDTDTQSQPLENVAKHLSTSATSHAEKGMTKALLLTAGLSSTANIEL